MPAMEEARSLLLSFLGILDRRLQRDLETKHTRQCDTIRRDTIRYEMLGYNTFIC